MDTEPLFNAMKAASYLCDHNEDVQGCIDDLSFILGYLEVFGGLDELKIDDLNEVISGFCKQEFQRREDIARIMLYER